MILISKDKYFKEYYPFHIHLFKKDFFLLWFTNSFDGFIIENDRLVSFNSLKTLLDYARNKNLKINKEVSRLSNLDDVESWLNSSDSQNISIDFVRILEIGNLEFGIRHI